MENLTFKILYYIMSSSLEGGIIIQMIKDEKASLSIRRIACMSIILMLVLGVSVMATNLKFNNVRIILSNNYEMNVLTTKTNVGEILEENHIVVLPEEIVVPNMEAQINNNNVIAITKATEDNAVVKLAEENEDVSIEQLLVDYSPLIEKIITEQIEIPYETITKDAQIADESAINEVIQQGENGLKEITYRAKFKNDVEVERTVLSEKTIKEPVNKIVQVNKKAVTSRAGIKRENNKDETTNALAKKVAGKKPQIKNFNTSAYCSCSKCCGKESKITASGAQASSWHTLAAGKGYPVGTIIYIPYFKDKPNGGWFVVQDRGGAISNNKLDVYMGTHLQALQFGRKNLECHVYM